MPAPPPATGEDHLYLLPRSSLGDYLSYMTSWPLGAAAADRDRLADEWLAADRLMQRLRREEPDFADVGPAGARPLPAALRPLADRVRADPVFRRAFAGTTHDLAVVDLERLVVSQKLIHIAHVEQVMRQLGPSPSPGDVFRFCLPCDRVLPPHRANRVGDEEFAFASDSNDLRFLDAVMLRPDQLVGYQPAGPVAGVVALVVGFGSNYLHVLAANGRLVLNNGNHRACALYACGVREVPCVVQTIVHPDEIDAHAPRAVRRNRDYYLTAPRPTVLKDYTNPDLVRRIRLALTTRQVRVRYSVEEMDMP